MICVKTLINFGHPPFSHVVNLCRLP
jgi:hypothetical protein